MSRNWWIVVILVACGVGLAVLVGVLGTRNEPTKSEALSTFCGSLQQLDSSVNTLVNIDTSTATTAEFQSDVDAVQSDWNQVKTDAQAVQDAQMGSLDSAWDSFESAVKSIPSDATVQAAVSDVTQAANQLVTTAQSTAASVNCSS